MKTLIALLASAALLLAEESAPSVPKSSEDGILKTSTEVQQVIFVFTPGVASPKVDIITHDVQWFGVEMLGTKNVRVISRDFSTVTNAVPALALAFAQFKAILPTILTNTP